MNWIGTVSDGETDYHLTNRPIPSFSDHKLWENLHKEEPLPIES